MSIDNVIALLLALGGLSGLVAAYFAGKKTRTDTIAQQQETIGQALEQIDRLIKSRADDRMVLTKALDDIRVLQNQSEEMKDQIRDRDRSIDKLNHDNASLSNDNANLKVQVGALTQRVRELERSTNQGV